MACPVPESPPTPPTLGALVEQLAALDTTGAQGHREEVQELERRLQQAREQLAADEASLARVDPDGSAGVYDEWCLRSSAVSGSRRAVRLLEVDVAVRREVLERALFLARQDRAAGRERCRECEGTGEGPAIPGGIAIDYPPCDTCRGTGMARVAVRKAGAP